MTEIAHQRCPKCGNYNDSETHKFCAEAPVAPSRSAATEPICTAVIDFKAMKICGNVENHIIHKEGWRLHAFQPAQNPDVAASAAPPSATATVGYYCSVCGVQPVSCEHWGFGAAPPSEREALVAELKAARTAWHEDFGVPVSAEYARFLRAIGNLIDWMEGKNFDTWDQPICFQFDGVRFTLEKVEAGATAPPKEGK